MKISVPKNWKVIRRSFASIVWQQGQKDCICRPGGQPKYDGWKWTTKVQVAVKYDEGSLVWKVTLTRPHHPTTTIKTCIVLDNALESAHEVMKSMNTKYPEEEYAS
jgi:hypothetical protein